MRGGSAAFQFSRPPSIGAAATMRPSIRRKPPFVNYARPKPRRDVSAIIGIHPQQSTAREAAERKLQQAQTAKQKLFLRDRVLDATRVLETSVDAFSNLWRHERALTRSLHRTLHELQRLQAIRAGEHVPAPAVIDVNLGAASEHARDIESGLEDALEVNLEGDLQ
jgi:hypothetical protein